MLARLSFILLSLFFGGKLLAQDQANKCSIFHEGKFKLVSTVSGKDYIITRTKKYQTEQEEGDAQEYVFKIKWIDDCTYELRPYKVPADFKKSWSKKDVLVVEIREVEGNKCTCYAQFKKTGSKVTITHLEKIN